MNVPQGGTGKIRRIPFDDSTAAEVAGALGGADATAPFRLPSGTVYQVLMTGQEGRAAVLLTLWPTIRRVDAVGPGVTVVFTDVAEIDLVGDIEVQFRRAIREYLIVTRAGKVIVRA
jgi:hypothetical protein